MAHFNSMAEFRAAINGLVASGGKKKARKNKKVARRNPTARRNMAFPKVVDGIQFDSMDELLSYKRGMGGGASPRQSLAFHERPKARKPRKATARKARTYKDVFLQIVHSVGGARALCPGVDWTDARNRANAAGVTSYEVILGDLGLDRNGAAGVAALLDSEGLLSRGSKDKKGAAAEARAMEILASAGVRCPSRKNPRRW